LDPCLDHESVTAQVEDWLGRDEIDARLRIVIDEAEGVPYFTIALGGAARQGRSFPNLPSECQEQPRAVALSIALAVDALLPGSVHAGPRAAQWILGLDLGALTPLPAKPALGAGASLSHGLAPWFRPALGFLVLSATDQPVTDQGPARFDVRAAVLRLSGCFVMHPGDGTLALGACPGVWLGPLTTSASGVSSPRSETELWGALATALELHVRLGTSIGLHVGADVMFAMHKSSVEVWGGDGKPASERPFPRVLGAVRLGPTIFF
jgi:hypothetical protein